MDQATHNKIVSFIWGIADDVLRDLVRRGKYPGVILPMCVLREVFPGGRAACGKQILVTVSHELATEVGAGVTYTAPVRMADGREIGLSWGTA